MARPWIRVLFAFHLTPVFGKLWSTILGLAIYSACVLAFIQSYWTSFPGIQADIHGLLGLALGLLLVFRTSTSNDRWWEGRQLWGQLINETRNLAIKLRTQVHTDFADRQAAARIAVQFAYALKLHLRHGARLQDLAPFRAATERPTHVPSYLVRKLMERTAAWKAAGCIDGFETLLLDRHLSALMDICGGCERIRNTPITRSHLDYIRQCLAVFLLTLPWGLCKDLGWWTFPVVVMLGYFMIGIELIAETVEEPFGTDQDDIGLDRLCHVIEETVEDVFRN